MLSYAAASPSLWPCVAVCSMLNVQRDDLQLSWEDVGCRCMHHEALGTRSGGSTLPPARVPPSLLTRLCLPIPCCTPPATSLPLFCRLQKLPDAIAALTALVRLECSDNGSLAALPAALGAAQRTLGAVLAERCALRVCPPGLARASGLRVLSLATNALTDIPADAFAGVRPAL